MAKQRRPSVSGARRSSPPRANTRHRRSSTRRRRSWSRRPRPCSFATPDAGRNRVEKNTTSCFLAYHLMTAFPGLLKHRGAAAAQRHERQRNATQRVAVGVEWCTAHNDTSARPPPRSMPHSGSSAANSVTDTGHEPATIPTVRSTARMATPPLGRARRLFAAPERAGSFAAPERAGSLRSCRAAQRRDGTGLRQTHDRNPM